MERALGGMFRQRVTLLIIVTLEHDILGMGGMVEEWRAWSGHSRPGVTAL